MDLSYIEYLRLDCVCGLCNTSSASSGLSTKERIVLPAITDEMAEVVLSKFFKCIAKNPHPANRPRRNVEAMRAGLEELRRSQMSLYAPSAVYVSARQYGIVELMANESLTYNEIALRLGIAPSTVRTHLHELYKLLNGRPDRGRVTHMFHQGLIQLKA